MNLEFNGNKPTAHSGDQRRAGYCARLAKLGFGLALAGSLLLMAKADEPSERALTEWGNRQLEPERAGLFASLLRGRFSLEITQRPSEVDATQPAVDFASSVGSVRIGSLVRELPGADQDFVTHWLTRSGLLHKGALAIGNLRVGYGELFRAETVIETGRNGTRWEEPKYLFVKTCFAF